MSGTLPPQRLLHAISCLNATVDRHCKGLIEDRADMFSGYTRVRYTISMGADVDLASLRSLAETFEGARAVEYIVTGFRLERTPSTSHVSVLDIEIADAKTRAQRPFLLEPPPPPSPSTLHQAAPSLQDHAAFASGQSITGPLAPRDGPLELTPESGALVTVTDEPRATGRTARWSAPWSSVVAAMVPGDASRPKRPRTSAGSADVASADASWNEWMVHSLRTLTGANEVEQDMCQVADLLGIPRCRLRFIESLNRRFHAAVLDASIARFAPAPFAFEPMSKDPKEKSPCYCFIIGLRDCYSIDLNGIQAPCAHIQANTGLNELYVARFHLANARLQASLSYRHCPIHKLPPQK
jgi:hypothetical protein